MASTRNKNNYNNYCHSQAELTKHRNYLVEPMKRINDHSAYPNVGINAPQYMPNTLLSKASVDIESRLFGINATNLVNPDFAKYGESFGLKCFRIHNTEEILPTIKSAMEVDGPSLIEFKMSLELNTSTTTISQLQTN